ncbi:MAG: alcohol dehydrogenase catalytic domain-containing protein [Thermoleophilia bacterium]
MKVGMYYCNADVRLEEQERPVVRPGDVLIKVRASGICGSDLMEWYRIKRAPLVLGHEVTGDIVEVGEDVTGLMVGDRVFATHHVPCGECRECLRGHETACRTFQEVNNFAPGGFAQFLRVTGRSVRTGILKLPDEVAYETGTFVEPLATVVRALRTIRLAPTEGVLVYGAGLAGLLFVKLAKALGAGVVAVADIDEFRLAAARSAGADLAVHAGDDVAARFAEHAGRPADHVVICTGAASAADAAMRSVGRGGTALFFAVGKPGETLAVDFNPFWRNDISLRTCYGAAPFDNVQALELLRRGTVQVDDMITHRFPLEQVGEAFRMAAQPSACLKVILRPND